MAKTVPTKERTRKYSKKRAGERDEVRVAVWVPSSRTEDLKRYAAALRAEEDLKVGRPCPTPSVVVPEFEVPELPPQSWSYLRIKESELGLRMLVKANGGEWIRGNSKVDATWKLRSDLVDKLGLRERVVHEKEE